VFDAEPPVLSKNLRVHVVTQRNLLLLVSFSWAPLMIWQCSSGVSSSSCGWLVGLLEEFKDLVLQSSVAQSSGGDGDCDDCFGSVRSRKCHSMLICSCSSCCVVLFLLVHTYQRLHFTWSQFTSTSFLNLFPEEFSEACCKCFDSLELFSWAYGLFGCTPKCQIFQDFPSHRIFGRMHEALNIDKK
jgi:hypothetical protein